MEKIILPGVPRVLKPEHLLQDGSYHNKDKSACCILGWLEVGLGRWDFQVVLKLMNVLPSFANRDIIRFNDENPAQEVCNVWNSIFEGTVE